MAEDDRNRRPSSPSSGIAMKSMTLRGDASDFVGSGVIGGRAYYTTANNNNNNNNNSIHNNNNNRTTITSSSQSDNGIPDAYVWLYSCNPTKWLDYAVTSSNGAYRFRELGPGRYSIGAAPPEGCAFSFGDGDGDYEDGEFDGEEGRTECFDLEEGGRVKVMLRCSSFGLHHEMNTTEDDDANVDVVDTVDGALHPPSEEGTNVTVTATPTFNPTSNPTSRPTTHPPSSRSPISTSSTSPTFMPFDSNNESIADLHPAPSPRESHPPSPRESPASSTSSSSSSSSSTTTPSESPFANYDPLATSSQHQFETDAHRHDDASSSSSSSAPLFRPNNDDMPHPNNNNRPPSPTQLAYDNRHVTSSSSATTTDPVSTARSNIVVGKENNNDIYDDYATTTTITNNNNGAAAAVNDNKPIHETIGIASITAAILAILASAYFAVRYTRKQRHYSRCVVNRDIGNAAVDMDATMSLSCVKSDSGGDGGDDGDGGSSIAMDDIE